MRAAHGASRDPGSRPMVRPGSGFRTHRFPGWRVLSLQQLPAAVRGIDGYQPELAAAAGLSVLGAVVALSLRS
jgi:hypothetical protein